MLTSDWFDSDFQVKLENDVNILRLTPFSGSLPAMVKFLKGTKVLWAVLTFFVGLLPMWLPNDADGAPVIRLTSPKSRTAAVPEESGLLIEVEISDGTIPNPAGNSAVSWSVLEAPEGGAVIFSPPTGLATVATFNVPGSYRILISATTDGVNTGTKELAVEVGSNPDDNPELAGSGAYLSMDDGKGNTATDSRGVQNNGLLFNGASWTGPDGGISGTGIILDGIDDEISFKVEDFDEIDLAFKERTMTLWFKADDPLRNTKQVFYKEGDLDSGFNVYLEAGRLYVGGWKSEVDVREEIFLSTELADTNWHHVGLVLKDDDIPYTSIKTFEGYLDGEQFQSGEENTFTIKTLTSKFDRTFTIGSNGGTARYHDDSVARGPRDNFAGIVDEFQIWNRPLTPEEIRQLFMTKLSDHHRVSLASVDLLAGSVVIPPGMGIVLDGSTKGKSSMATKWETVIAPEGGEVRFLNPAHPSTLATFSTPGYYKLRLSADYGIQKSALDVDVHAGLAAGSNFPSSRESVYYSMDEGSGEFVGNSADAGKPGNLSNPSGWTPKGGGISGTAIQLDGTDDYIGVNTNYPIQHPVEKISLALWIKPIGISRSEKEFIFQIGDRSAGINIYLDGDLLYFGNWDEGDFSRGTFLAVPITRGRWNHVALVFDPYGSNSHFEGLRGYLNGSQVASGSAASGIDSRMDEGTIGAHLQGSYFHDGNANDNLWYAFSGMVDEFHYYQDHALTIDEIGMLYAFGNVGPAVDAGPDQLVFLPSSMVLLEGSSTDDGRWSGPVTYSWHILDGPSTGGFRPLEDNGASADLGSVFPGSYRFALGAFDGQVTTFDEMMVTVRHPTPFELFMLGFPAIAVDERSYDADPDGDHRTNLAEYAMGGSPDVNETHYQLGLHYELVREAGLWYAEFRYPRRRDAAQRGLRYEFQVSDDLSAGSWMNRGYTVLNITPMDEVFWEVRLRIDQPVGSANPRLFGRVRVELAVAKGTEAQRHKGTKGGEAR